MQKITLLRSLLTALMIAVFFPTQSWGEIRWLEKDYDFGLMKEIAGAKTGTARFVNIGPGPTYIRNVRPSCGCTGAEFTEGIIEEGDTAVITFTYNPAGRPGKFDKTIKTFVGEDNKMHVIHIRGTVIGSPETLSANFPYELGPLRYSDRVIPAGNVTYGQTRHYFVSLTNQTADSIRPTVASANAAVATYISPEVIAPGDLGTVAVTLTTRDESELGPHDYAIRLVSDADAQFPEETELTLKVNIEPDLQSLDGVTLENAPQLSVSPDVIEAGRVKAGQPLTVRFTVRNAGGSTLMLRRIYSPRGGVTAKRYPTRLEPGKKGEAEITISPELTVAGTLRVPVEISSNDPLHPVTEIRVVGEAK